MWERRGACWAGGPQAALAPAARRSPLSQVVISIVYSQLWRLLLQVTLGCPGSPTLMSWLLTQKSQSLWELSMDCGWDPLQGTQGPGDPGAARPWAPWLWLPGTRMSVSVDGQDGWQPDRVALSRLVLGSGPPLPEIASLSRPLGAQGPWWGSGLHLSPKKMWRLVARPAGCPEV